MSTMLPLRQLHRSAKVGIGSKDLAPGRTVLVNIDNPRVSRDLARHSSIGQLYQVGAAFPQADSGTIETGGVITVSGLTATSTAVAGRSSAGVAFSGAADTEVLTVPVTTNGRVNLLSVTLAAPQTLVETEGTATTPLLGANAVQLGGRPAVPALSVALAYVVWAPAVSATVVVATNVWTQTAHGYTDGQKLLVATITTITTPAAGTELYVKKIDVDTFTLSATVGGTDFDATAADGSALLVPLPTIIDARP